MPELTQPIADVTVPREPVHELVREVARVTPNSVAVTGIGAEVTYRDLDIAVESLRQALQQHGCAAGDSVGVSIAPGPAHVTALLGVLRAGANVVCLNPDDESDRARAALANVGAQWLVTEDGRFNIQRLKETPGAGNTSIAYIAYTSGSTGRPKGIAQSHAALTQFVTWMSAEFTIDQHARVAQWAVPSYDASLCEVFMTLTAGARLYPIAGRARINPDTMLYWLEQNAITHFQTVPSFAKEIVAAVRRRRSPVNLPSLTHVLLAGEVLSGELAASLRKVVPTARVINLYGPTESILATWHEVDSGLPGTVPVGEAIPGRNVVVVDQQDAQCPPGEPGEIVVISPFVATGYLGVRQDESAFRPLREDTTGVPTYRTGDRGRYLPDGAIEFLGRRDSQIKILGKRLELAEVEAALADEPSIQHSVVIAIPGADGLVTRLVAFVMPADGERHARLARRCRDRLREWFGSTGVPVSVRPIDRLPRTATGKVDRKRLADLATGTSEADDRM